MPTALASRVLKALAEYCSRKESTAVAAFLAQYETEVSGAAESPLGTSKSLSLQLEVTDPEVVVELRSSWLRSPSTARLR